MHYTKVYLDAFGYELAPHVVSSEDLEARLTPMYEALHFSMGQLEALTGIEERRYWDPDMPLSTGAMRAGQKALAASTITTKEIGMLIYGGVCRENLEPATACAVAHGLGLGPDTMVFDVSNACLGVLNGMLQIANAIELGQIGAGMVVSCESARQIVDLTIERILESKDMDVFKETIATLTGGSGAVAVILTAADLAAGGHRLMGGVLKNAVEHHKLCIWGPDSGVPASAPQVTKTDSVGVLKNGVALGIETYAAFKEELDLPADKPDKVICHQVGSAHQKTILESLQIPAERDFTTYQYLGNMGTAALPVTAAIAHERGFLSRGDTVGFLGIGSGLNCLILGLEW